MVTQKWQSLKLEPCMVIPLEVSDYKIYKNTLRKKLNFEYWKLHNFILHGFPAHRSQLPESCGQFWHIHEHLSIDDDLIVYGCRLLIPLKLR